MRFNIKGVRHTMLIIDPVRVCPKPQALTKQKSMSAPLAKLDNGTATAGEEEGEQPDNTPGVKKRPMRMSAEGAWLFGKSVGHLGLLARAAGNHLDGSRGNQKG